MSLRVSLLFNFPQYKVIAVSIVIITVGVCSIGASVYGLWKRIWEHDFAPGIWGGALCVLSGILGLCASHFKGVYSVHSFMILSYFACLASAAQLSLSIRGLIYGIENKNTGSTSLINGLNVGFSFTQILLSLFSAVICTRQVCCFKQKQNNRMGNKSKSSFTRGELRASGSSNMPLVSSQRSRHSKKKSSRQKTSEYVDVRSGQNVQQNGNTTNISITASNEVIRGRRYGNMPVMGSNIVEKNQNKQNEYRSKVNMEIMSRSNQHRQHQQRDSRRSPRPRHIDYERSRHTRNREERGRANHQEQERLLKEHRRSHSMNDRNFAYADDVESPVKEKMTHEKELFVRSYDADVRQDVMIHSLRQPRSPLIEKRSFIPIESVVQHPVSIDEDEQLPPYEATASQSIPDSAKLCTGITTERKDGVLTSHDTCAPEFESAVQELKSESPILSTCTLVPETECGNFLGQSDRKDAIISSIESNTSALTSNDSLPRAEFPVCFERNLSKEERRRCHVFDTDGESSDNDSSLRSFDPQGISYYGLKRNQDSILCNDSWSIRSESTGRHIDDAGESENRMENVESMSGSTEIDGKSESKVKDESVSHSHPNIFFSPVDPRRLSQASAMSLPPPKPQRTFLHDKYMEMERNNEKNFKRNRKSSSLKFSGSSRSGDYFVAHAKSGDRKYFKYDFESFINSEVPVWDMEIETIEAHTNVTENTNKSVPSEPSAHSSPKQKESSNTLQSPGISPITLSKGQTNTCNKEESTKTEFQGKDSETLNSQKSKSAVLSVKDEVVNNTGRISKKVKEDALSLQPYLVHSHPQFKETNQRIYTAARGSRVVAPTSSPEQDGFRDPDPGDGLLFQSEDTGYHSELSVHEIPVLLSESLNSSKEKPLQATNGEISDKVNDQRTVVTDSDCVSESSPSPTGRTKTGDHAAVTQTEGASGDDRGTRHRLQSAPNLGQQDRKVSGKPIYSILL